MSDASKLQGQYYASTANSYIDRHVLVGDEHFVALEYIRMFMSGLGCTSALDVGAGTGRGIGFLKASAATELHAVGVEPVAALRDKGVADGYEIIEASGQSLPFASEAFDVVFATGVLHHVERPESVLAEMCRVARVAVFVSDSNRFGQGGLAARLLKSGIYGVGLGRTFERFRTRGKGYMESEGDGIFYSYSIYDSHRYLRNWGDRTFIIPLGSLNAAPGRLSSTHGLLASLREPAHGWAGLEACK